MNFTRLRYFVVTAEEANVVRAARRLRIAQPALSRQLHALEREVGTQLFERHARGVRLLPAGTAFLEYARRLLADADAASAAARKAAGAAKCARLRVAPPDWPHRATWVAGAVERLHTLHPEVSIEFDATPWLVHADALRAGTIDVGFGVAVEPTDFGDGIAAEHLCDEPASSAILPATHPLARRSSVTLAELRDLPTIIPPRDVAPPLHDQMLGTVRRGGYEPRVVSASASFSAAASMVVAGAGWIIAINSVAELPPPGTAVVPIADAAVMLGFFLLRRSDDEREFSRALLVCLREVVAQTAARRRDQSPAGTSSLRHEPE